jgi:hypothetical protein
MLIILLFVSISILSAVDSSSPERFYLRARNEYLRAYIFNKRDGWKMRLSSVANCVMATNHALKEKANAIYQAGLSKYYDANALYYSLSEEDREIIEQIINLHF